MAIRVICEYCNSKIDASDRLLGERRKCPRCDQEIIIKPAEPEKRSVPVPGRVPVPAGIVVNATTRLNHPGDQIKRLMPSNLYLILSYDRIVAVWRPVENWMINVGSGFLPAKRNTESIPEHGNYVFIEGNVRHTENGRRLVGIRFFELSGYNVLVSIARNENELLEKLSSQVPLSTTQKQLFFAYLREQFFRNFTDDAPEIVNYLLSQDELTTQVGDLTEQPFVLGE